LFLGIPPDYRNDYDITNAVSTFIKFHSWASDDPIKCRALVYASFPSPQLVPHDVVFGKYSFVGRVKKSWTAALYILTADFADALPVDKDQMPLDGNPHPLSGQLLQNLNLFVMPQFPEIGWDVVQQPEPQQNHDVQHENEPEVQMQEDEQESMVMNPSLQSSSSVNFHVNQQQLQVGFVRTFFIGLVLAPDMFW
jgi:hypothetical protein